MVSTAWSIDQGSHVAQSWHHIPITPTSHFVCPAEIEIYVSSRTSEGGFFGASMLENHRQWCSRHGRTKCENRKAPAACDTGIMGSSDPIFHNRSPQYEDVVHVRRCAGRNTLLMEGNVNECEWIRVGHTNVRRPCVKRYHPRANKRRVESPK